MADEESEYERPRKVPRTLKEKDTGKRLIVILERASLETVKVLGEIDYLTPRGWQRAQIQMKRTVTCTTVLVPFN